MEHGFDLQWDITTRLHLHFYTINEGRNRNNLKRHQVINIHHGALSSTVLSSETKQSISSMRWGFHRCPSTINLQLNRFNHNIFSEYTTLLSISFKAIGRNIISSLLPKTSMNEMIYCFCSSTKSSQRSSCYKWWVTVVLQKISYWMEHVTAISWLLCGS